MERSDVSLKLGDKVGLRCGHAAAVYFDNKTVDGVLVALKPEALTVWCRRDGLIHLYDTHDFDVVQVNGEPVDEREGSDWLPLAAWAAVIVALFVAVVVVNRQFVTL